MSSVRRRVAIVGNDDFSIWHFRRGIIRALVASGFEVDVFTPGGPFLSRIEGLGVRCIPLCMPRFMSPLRDLALVVRLVLLFRRGRYEFVHTMTIKPNIYGTIAAWVAGVRSRYGLISGLGFMFQSGSGGAENSRKLAERLYRFALSKSTRVWFQNSDDLRVFEQRKLISSGKGVVILGSGINLEEFSPSSVPPEALIQQRQRLKIPEDGKVVLLVANRMIWSKGIAEFVTAAERVYQNFPGWYFVLLAPREEGSPDSVPPAFFDRGASSNLIIIDSFQADVRPLLGIADIMTLPSFYPEGVPRSILEAMSFALPIVTTDTAGCRETVIEGGNGFLIPVRDSGALVDRLVHLMSDDLMRERYGQASRRLAEERFSEAQVVRRVFEDLYQVGTRKDEHE